MSLKVSASPGSKAKSWELFLGVNLMMDSGAAGLD
jgi:hypothetical protein